jgi:transposase
MGNCAGIDWASDKHDVLIANDAGDHIVGKVVTHDHAGLTSLVELLLEHEVERVTIERPDGVLVDYMLAAGINVLAIHPNQVKAARDRFRTSGGKSDKFDAYVLCELARTDHHRFRPLVRNSAQTEALKALTRAREDLIGARVALANQLRAQLDAFWPGAKTIFSDIDSPIALAFLERYPSPADTRGLGPARMRSFLARHHYCGRRSAEQLLERLRNAPHGRATDTEAESRRAIVLSLVATLRPLVQQIRLMSSEIAGAIREHPDGAIFLPIFRDPKSTITAARIVAELGDDRSRYPTAEAMAADAGMSPVAVESGKRRVAVFRYGCDKRLRTAISTLADSTRHHHPWARQIYTRARARGCTHPHAIRILGRAWIRVLWRCWHDHTPYDPERHGALQALSTTKG